MKNWDINTLQLRPHAPQILSSTPDARAIAIAIPAGESMQDHQVHERAWVTVIEGDVQITTAAGEQITGSTGLLVEFDPRERHAVAARTDARILLLLTPWPGAGHPGAMTIHEKEQARQDAAEHVATAAHDNVRRLLVVCDAAVGDVDELPPPVRTQIDAAADVYVVTPSLPGRLAWLATQVNASRHAADKRLDTTLGQMQSLGATATGITGDDSTLTAFSDAVTAFRPDHILIALRSSEHTNWQEHGLIEKVRQRFGLPVTTFAVDPRGHVLPSPTDRTS
ncbi:MAG: cupin domain-containing protein [Solirubrobacteraceae bacterium]